MNYKIQHTPDGVRDIYGEECERKRQMEETLHEVMHAFGYRDIETPMIEFFDVFGSEIGTIPSSELYKFFDREGHTLVLRPDFTPSIARAASRFMEADGSPVRLCYRGNVFVNYSSYQGRLKESTEMGVELMRDARVDADAEVVALAIRMLLRSGLKDFQITIGHAGFFEAICREAGLDEETIGTLRTLVHNRNSFGVEKLLSEHQVPQPLEQVIASLPVRFGSVEVIDEMLSQLSSSEPEGGAPSEAAAALRRLKELDGLLRIYGVEEYISYDLGLMSQYMYYTGIIFRGYTYGSGEAVIKGGRYDRLLECFGQNCPSIGFVVVMNQLMNAVRRQGTDAGAARELQQIRYRSEEREKAIREAMRLREEGRCVELVCEDE